MPAPRRGESKEQAKARRLREKAEREKAGGAGPDLEKIASGADGGDKAKASSPSASALQQALRDQKRIMASAVAVPFRMIARKRGSHWELDEVEKQDLGAAVVECMIAYLPDDLSKHFPLFYLGASLSAILSKRFEAEDEMRRGYAAAIGESTGAVN